MARCEWCGCLVPPHHYHRRLKPPPRRPDQRWCKVTEGADYLQGGPIEPGRFSTRRLPPGPVFRRDMSRPATAARP